MRVSLQIDGDSSGAVKAAQDAGTSIDDLAKKAGSSASALDKVNASFSKMHEAATTSGAANDNGANAALKFAERISQVAQAATGAESALSKGTAGAISFAKGVGDLFKTVGTANVIGGAIGLAVNAAQTFFSVINSGAADANRRLSDQATEINVIRDAFSGATSKADEFYKKYAATVRFKAENDLADAQADYKRGISSITAGNSFQPKHVESFGGEVSIGFEQATSAASALQETLDNLFASFQRGETTADDAARKIAEIGSAARGTQPEIVAVAKSYLNALEPIQAAAAAMEKATAKINLTRRIDVEKSLKTLGIEAGQTSNEFERLSKSMERQAAAQEAEARAAGKSVGEAARLRAELTLQEAANQAGIKSTAELAAQIDKLATRYSEAAQKSGLAKLQSDAGFDRAQLGRTADEAALAAQLRGVFGDNADLDSGIAATIRANNEMKELKATAQDLATGAISDLRQQVQTLGVTWQAAGNVAVNAINRIIDKLASKALDAQISKLFNLLGGGIELNANGSIAGAVGPTSVGGAPLVGFDSGGWTGSGGKYQVAGVVHREEFVFDQDATRRIGPDNLERLRRGGVPGYAGGGLVGGVPPWGDLSAGTGGGSSGGTQALRVDVGVSVDDDGKLQGYVKRISRSSADQAVTDFVGSDAFVAHTDAAAKTARSRAY